jgi:GntR family transcriptional regulator
MVFHVNFKSGLPVYLQLVDQIKAAAAAGALRPGDSLPGIRPLAEQLRINRNTVAKAYAELESQGVVDTQTGRGCYIKENHSPFRREVREKILGEAIDALLVQAHHFQVKIDDLLELVRQHQLVFARMAAKQGE